MQRLKIALCQTIPSFDKEENVGRALGMVDEAVRNGAHLVAFPEMMYLPFELLRLRSVGEDPAIIERFKDRGRRHGVYLCTGSTVTMKDNRRYNTSHLIDPAGKEILTYDKCHLFDADLDGVRIRESLVFSHGDHFATAPTDIGNIGIIICYDIRFPEMTRQAALLGTELLVVPAVFSDVTGPAHWECLLRARAIENQFFVAAVSQGRSSNPDVSYRSYGHSMVVSPWGDIIAEAGQEETILYAELDPELLAIARKRLPLLQHRRDKLYTSFNR